MKWTLLCTQKYEVILVKSKILLNYSQSVCTKWIPLIVIYIKFGMVIPVVVKYDLESEATLYSLTKYLNVYLKHVFFYFRQPFFCDIFILFKWFVCPLTVSCIYAVFFCHPCLKCKEEDMCVGVCFVDWMLYLYFTVWPYKIYFSKNLLPILCN